jgi:hypothetical protein
MRLEVQNGDGETGVIYLLFPVVGPGCGLEGACLFRRGFYFCPRPNRRKITGPHLGGILQNVENCTMYAEVHQSGQPNNL